MAEPPYWCCAEAMMLAVKLPQTPNLPPPIELRQRILTALDAMVGRGRADGLSDADLAEARYALVAFIDEQILKSNWPGRAEWMGQPLQLILYGEYTAGENFFSRLRILLQQGGASLALEVYYLCLALGFRGAHGISGDHRALAGFHDAARQRVTQSWPAGSRLAPRAEPIDRLAARRTSNAPLVAMMVGSLLLAVLLVVGLERVLNSNLEETLEAMRAGTAGSSLPPARQYGGEPATPGPALATPAVTSAREDADQPVTLAPRAAMPPVTALPQRADQLAPTSSGTPKPGRAYPQNVADKPVPRIGEEPWMISEEWRTHHERQLVAPKRAQAKVVFLGDSITEAWQMAAAYREHFGKYSPLNLGIAGDHTQNLLWRIDQGTLDGIHPDAVVLLIGVNNLGGGFTPKQTVAGVRAVIAAVQARLPTTRLLLLAILPAGHGPMDPLRQKITEANRLLATLGEPGRVSVHDVGSVLLEPDGTITKATMRDFLHPTAAGYERLSEAVAPWLEKLMGG
jgi:type IV/VI secretion system ImpK/VasF family protein